MENLTDWLTFLSCGGNMKYLLVALENSAASMDILYTYSCSDDSVKVGDAVTIPFGFGNSRRRGFVFEVLSKTEYDPGKIKPILKVEPDVLSEEAVHLCRFIKSRYMCRYIDAVKCFIPTGYFKFESFMSITDDEAAARFLEENTRSKRQNELVKLLMENGPMEKVRLKKEFGFSDSVLKAVEEKNVAVFGKREKRRVPHKNLRPDREGFDGLTEEQKTAFDRIEDSLEKREKKVFLLHGVTGSGKTRLYMESVRKCLEQGRTAIVLVPEISLTVQTIERFKGEFGEDSVAILHSRLSEGERYDEWMRIKRGEVSIVMGVRSALFSPLKNVGVVVVDEEHESSYKADNSPKYDTRELAEERAAYNDAVLILGSATPSVSTYYRSEIGEIDKLVLTKRYNATPLPAVHIADMREELKKGNRSIFSVKLYEEITRCLEEKKQVILFLNRRGYSPFISCRSCGYVLKCEECGVSLNYHKSEKMAVCHYCGRKVPVPQKCPECGSPYIKDFGIGTEKVQEIAARLFPNARVGRLDLDTAGRKGSTEEILADFKEGRTDILVGTQLVTKGLDFRGVDLVGVIAADISLNIPDYRAGENTFQLVTQAAGRAGRGDKRGTVVVQTYSPDNYSLKAAVKHDYESFYEQECEIRRMLAYPPFGTIVQVVFSSVDSDKAEACSEAFIDRFRAEFEATEKFNILGPKQSHILKNKGRYRFRVLVIYKDKDIDECMKKIDGIRSELASGPHHDTLIGIDINPYSFI